MKKLLRIYTVVALSISLFSCAKNSDYTKYLESGEIRYAAKPEELKAYPGKERIKLEWTIVSDQNITKAKVYWRNKADSIELPITRGTGIDTISTVIPLSEGSYSFDVIHFHNDGVRSLAANVSSVSYGVGYESMLLNRGLRSYSWTPTNQGIILNWGTADATVIGTKVNYININNDPREFVVPGNALSANYTRLMRDTYLEYKTMYKPDTLSIDTFYSQINKILVNY